MTATRACPGCESALPDDAPQGLCPRCLLKGAMAETEAGGDAEALERQHVEAVLNSRLPGYKVIRLLGRGGMGEVWLADQPALRRQVAIKVLPVELSGRPGFAERFQREAQVLAGLDHPHIVRIHDYGSVEGLSFFVTEYCPSTLRQVMPKWRKIDVWEEMKSGSLLSRFKSLCEAVAFAHDKGVVHRDIKPENVLWNDRGVVLGDFGLAGLLEGEARLSEPGAPGAGRLTAAGQVMGTPRYMAPEQRQPGANADHRADIYALGLVLHELLTDDVPAGSAGIDTKKISDARLAGIIAKCLAADPDGRYADIAELVEDVEKVLGRSRFVAIVADLFWAYTAVAVMMLTINPMVGGKSAASYTLFIGLGWLAMRGWYLTRLGQLIVGLAYAVATAAFLIGPVMGWEERPFGLRADRFFETVGALCGTMGLYLGLRGALFNLLLLSPSLRGSLLAKVDPTPAAPGERVKLKEVWNVLLFLVALLVGSLAIISLWADWRTLTNWLPFTILTILLAGEVGMYFASRLAPDPFRDGDKIWRRALIALRSR